MVRGAGDVSRFSQARKAAVVGIVADVLGTGVDVVATRSMPAV